MRVIFLLCRGFSMLTVQTFLLVSARVTCQLANRDRERVSFYMSKASAS